MTVDANVPFTTGTQVTISGVDAANANTIVNGQTFFIKLAVDYPTSGNVTLHTSTDYANTNVSGTNLGQPTANGIATSVLSSGSGGGAVGGSNTSVQFNDSNLSNGVAGFTFNKNTTTLTVAGPIIGTTVNASTSMTSPVFVSNIATGTAPLTVTSTTRVANLDVAKSGIANTVNDAAQPNITSTGTLVSLSVSGNANVGNLGTAGLVSATGNITGGNLVTGGALSVTANANIGNIGTSGLITATGNVNAGNLITGGLVSATGNGTFGNVTATLYVGNLSGTGNSNVGNIGGNNAVFTTFSGSGSGLTSVPGANVTGAVAYATTANSVAGANVTGAVAYATTANSVAGANVSGAVAYATTANAVAGANVSGQVTYAATANAVAGANVSGAVAYATTANSVAGANVSGTVSSATTAGTVTTAAQPNITSVSSSFTSLTFANAQTITANNVTISTGANTNLGTLTGNWSLSTGSKLQATYADLAEYYEADQVYEPGTVLQFGGSKEVTIAEDGTTRVAGVVSTHPAYVMNSSCEGDAVALALQGRVPTKVRGTIRKGDMMISGGNGYARPAISPVIGSVIGKALQDFDGIEGVIEVAVGRL
jgi:hypothetical protein